MHVITWPRRRRPARPLGDESRWHRWQPGTSTTSARGRRCRSGSPFFTNALRHAKRSIDDLDLRFLDLVGSVEDVAEALGVSTMGLAAGG